MDATAAITGTSLALAAGLLVGGLVFVWWRKRSGPDILDAAQGVVFGVAASLMAGFVSAGSVYYTYNFVGPNSDTPAIAPPITLAPTTAPTTEPLKPPPAEAYLVDLNPAIPRGGAGIGLAIVDGVRYPKSFRHRPITDPIVVSIGANYSILTASVGYEDGSQTPATTLYVDVTRDVVTANSAWTRVEQVILPVKGVARLNVTLPQGTKGIRLSNVSDTLGFGNIIFVWGDIKVA